MKTKSWGLGEMDLLASRCFPTVCLQGKLVGRVGAGVVLHLEFRSLAFARLLGLEPGAQLGKNF